MCGVQNQRHDSPGLEEVRVCVWVAGNGSDKAGEETEIRL